MALILSTVLIQGCSKDSDTDIQSEPLANTENVTFVHSEKGYELYS